MSKHEQEMKELKIQQQNEKQAEINQLKEEREQIIIEFTKSDEAATTYQKQLKTYKKKYEQVVIEFDEYKLNANDYGDDDDEDSEPENSKFKL